MCISDRESPLFEEGVRGGYFLKKSNGDVWQTDLWQAGMAVLDVTNPAAVKWYSGKLDVYKRQARSGSTTSARTSASAARRSSACSVSA